MIPEKVSEQQIDLTLDGVTRRFEESLTKGVLIDCVKTRLLDALRYAPAYIDDLDLGDVLSVQPNVIGIAVRCLLAEERIRKTGQHRRSRRPGSNGRIIWEYTLA